MGLFDKVKGMLSSENNFTYLNDLIHSETKEIVLNTDIKLNEKELSTFRDGITLDVDNLIIDGNGFSIDGIGKTRFFNITGNSLMVELIMGGLSFWMVGHAYLRTAISKITLLMKKEVRSIWPLLLQVLRIALLKPIVQDMMEGHYWFMEDLA